MTKKDKFITFFKNKSFYQIYNNGGDLDDLCDLLSEDEIDKLIELNVQFIRSCSPSSTIILQDLIVNGQLTIINFDSGLKRLLHPKEFIAILFHEIGHVFNPGFTGIEAEYAADRFAGAKGYAKWIVSGLEKGVKNKWMGFEEASCRLRIDKLKEKFASLPNEN